MFDCRKERTMSRDIDPVPLPSKSNYPAPDGSLIRLLSRGMHSMPLPLRASSQSYLCRRIAQDCRRDLHPPGLAFRKLPLNKDIGGLPGLSNKPANTEDSG